MLPWTRRTTLALLVLLLATTTSLPFLVHPYHVVTNDASMYVVTARSLLAGEGYTFLGDPFIIRPPGFSVLLAAVIGLFGLDFHAIHLVVGASGIAIVVLLFLLFQPRIGTLPALGAAGLLWCSPGFRDLSTQAMSDVPGMVPVLLALLLWRRVRALPSPGGHLALGALVGLSAYLRTIGLLLGPAFLLDWWLGRKSGEARAPFRSVLLSSLAIPFLVLLPWQVRNALVASDEPADQTYLHSYSTGMWHEDPGDPSSPRHSLGAVLGRIPERAVEICASIGSSLSPRRESPGRTAVGTAVLLLALLAAGLRRRAEGFFLVSALLVLLPYFGYRTRLTLPLLLLTVPMATEILLLFLGRILPGRAPHVLALLVLSTVAYLDFSPRDGESAHRLQHETLVALAAEIDSLPATSRVAATTGWHLSVFTARPVYSLVYAVRRSGLEKGVAEVLNRRRIDSVVLVKGTDDSAVPYFRARYPVTRETERLLAFDVR
jgi:4-amino-4-deoxy-L-arabinose transferase-like glycosyltransferase